MDLLLLISLALVATGARVAHADCSDRSYNCILSANVVYDKSTNSATTVRLTLSALLRCCIAHDDVA